MFKLVLTRIFLFILLATASNVLQIKNSVAKTFASVEQFQFGKSDPLNLPLNNDTGNIPVNTEDNEKDEKESKDSKEDIFDCDDYFISGNFKLTDFLILKHHTYTFFSGIIRCNYIEIITPPPQHM